MASEASRQPPQWWCHSCRNQVAPLMTPEPTCPLCHEQFLEQIEESADDPRDFDAGDGEGEGVDFLPAPGLMGPFFVGGGAAEGRQAAGPPFLNQLFQHMMGLAGAPPHAAHHHHDDDAPHGGLFGAAEHGQAYGGADRAAAANNEPPQSPHEVPVRNLAEFLSSAFGSPPPAHQARAASPRSASDPGPGVRPAEQQEQQQPPQPAVDVDGPGGALMRLFNALGAPMMAAGGQGGVQFVFGPGGMQGGQFGDYATQQGFDDIVTQLMEQAGGHYGPRPAPEEMVNELPKVKMTKELIESPSITDCAVCKDEFAVDDECLKLPCKHLFHEECVKPWLQQSGTCPVCRYELVEQPSSHAPRAGPMSPDGGVAAPAEGAVLPEDRHQAGQGPNVRQQMPGAFPFVNFFGGAPSPAAAGSGNGDRPRPNRRDTDEMPPLEDLD